MKSTLFLLFSLLLGIHTTTAQECAVVCPTFCVNELFQDMLCMSDTCAEACEVCQDRDPICADFCEGSGVGACYFPLCKECPFVIDKSDDALCSFTSETCPDECTASAAVTVPACFGCVGKDSNGDRFPGPPCAAHCSSLSCESSDPYCSGCDRCKNPKPSCDPYCMSSMCTSPLCTDCDFCSVPEDQCCDADCFIPDYTNQEQYDIPKNCQKTPENCGGCPQCRTCETWCNKMTCGYGVCDGCAFCQIGNEDSLVCPTWCSPNTCTGSSGAIDPPNDCSGCDFCADGVGIPREDPTCGDYCNAYTCANRIGEAIEECSGCNFCQEDAELCADTCSDITCKDDPMCNGCKFCKDFERCDSYCSAQMCSSAACEDCSFCKNGEPNVDVCASFCSELTCSWQEDFIEAERHHLGFCEDCSFCKSNKSKKSSKKKKKSKSKP